MNIEERFYRMATLLAEEQERHCKTMRDLEIEEKHVSALRCRIRKSVAEVIAEDELVILDKNGQYVTSGDFADLVCTQAIDNDD